MSDTQFEKPTPTLKVYRGWPTVGAHVWSPFVIKLEARLRFAGIPYTTESGSVSKSPNGKIPYVDHVDESGNSTIFSDSTLIINRLTDSNVLPNLSTSLSPEIKLLDLALRALLEEKLYFYHVRHTSTFSQLHSCHYSFNASRQTWERWTQNYYPMRDYILSSLPHPIRVIIGLLIYRKTTQTLHGQGTGRYSPEEIGTFRAEIWEHINGMLVVSQRGSSEGTPEPFWVLGGEQPTEADAVVFGFVVSVLVCTA